MTPVRVPQLTRDKCKHARPGVVEETVSVSRSLQAALLVAKLHSEAQEVANDLQNPEEYGDLLETLVALAELNGVTWHEITKAAAEKREAKGGFKLGLFWTSQDWMEGALDDRAAA